MAALSCPDIVKEREIKMDKVRFTLEIREDFLDDDKTQWVIEHCGDNRREHGPFSSLAQARELIARRKKEIAEATT